MRRRAFLAAAASLAPAAAQAAVPGGGAAYFAKMASFDAPDPVDVRLDRGQRALLAEVVARLARVQATVGFGNFGVIGFDRMLRVARAYPSVGAFTRRELEFMERVFFAEASALGFHGRKVVTRLTEVPEARRMVRVKGSPSWLFDGSPLQTFRRLRAQVGPDLVLTSGVRGVVKQFHLFLRKAHAANGNLSLASRSLAPPGYSFHGVGDFDVGQRGFGPGNFTAAFATTPVHARLAALGCARIRYPQDNLLGVRYEPWHIRVVA